MTVLVVGRGGGIARAVTLAARDAGAQVVGARLLDGTAPEVDQVGGRGHLGPVLAELVEGKVEHGHNRQTYAHRRSGGKRCPNPAAGDLG